MIILLYGSDTYRSRRKLNEIVDHYRKIHKSGLNLKYLNLKEKSFEDFRDEFWSASMFDEKKLIILEGAFLSQDFKENFLKNSKKLLASKDIILFYEKGEVPKGHSLFKFLKKCAKSQEFKLLEGQRLKNWAGKELESYGLKIEPEALTKLTNYVGNDLWRMTNEIRKLVNYKKNERIEDKDIELLIGPRIETDIFKTIDALALKDKKQALRLIHKHLEKGDSPIYLLSMIHFQFRNLLIIRELIERHYPYYAILKTSKLHPFVVKKNYQQAIKFSLQELKKIYQKIFQIDLSIKTGKIEPETALDLIIAGI